MQRLSPKVSNRTKKLNWIFLNGFTKDSHFLALGRVEK